MSNGRYEAKSLKTRGVDTEGGKKNQVSYC